VKRRMEVKEEYRGKIIYKDEEKRKETRAYGGEVSSGVLEDDLRYWL
jgi:hypothetical protein